MTVCQIAAATGLTRKAVRRYEDRGLLPPVPRTPAGYRLYDQAEVDTLTFIRRAPALDLSLDELRTILTLRRDGAAPCPQVGIMLDTRLAEVERAITELQALPCEPHRRAPGHDTRSCRSRARRTDLPGYSALTPLRCGQRCAAEVALTVKTNIAGRRRIRSGSPSCEIRRAAGARSPLTPIRQTEPSDSVPHVGTVASHLLLHLVSSRTPRGSPGSRRALRP
ncbi:MULTISPECIES: MerR family DNA-binding protein [Prauserella]